MDEQNNLSNNNNDDNEIIHYHVINMYEAFLHVCTVDGCGYTGYVCGN